MASTSCTPRTARRQSTARGFLPTSPLRGRTENAVKEGAKRKFLSTSPLRGTTWDCWGSLRRWREFLSTSPLRGTTTGNVQGAHLHFISIHVPLAGDDKAAEKLGVEVIYFYPRPPCGGRPLTFFRKSIMDNPFLSTSPLRGTTQTCRRLPIRSGISIHVPLAGDDWFPCFWQPFRYRFLSTSPLRGTTLMFCA